MITVHRARTVEEAAPLIDEYADSFQIVVRDSREDIAKYVSDERSGIWLACDDGKEVGCIALRPLRKRAGEVKRLYVRPGARRKGIAQVLLDSLEREASTIGFGWLYLDTNDDFPAAIAFYEREGYRRCLRYNDNPQATIFMRKLLSTEAAEVRPFRDGDERSFRELNEHWIQTYFALEPKDVEVLGKPREYILDKGGHILMAELAEEVIGCCALIALEDGGFEVAKMTVADDLRGKGIGKLLLQKTIEFARTRSIPRLYLETNDGLIQAIALYEACGFRHLPAERVTRSPYARANVYMELWL